MVLCGTLIHDIKCPNLINQPITYSSKVRSRVAHTMEERAMPWRDQEDDCRAGKTKARDPAQPSKQKKSEEIRKLEKYKYWIEFDATRHQFCKIMNSNFRNQLLVPISFSNNFRVKLPETIHLRGPSGHIWAVKLTKIDNQWLFQVGWEKFVQDHGLEENDFLVFRYKGNSSFTVTIWNMKTGCERVGSYFIEEHTSSCSRFCSALPNIDSDDDSKENDEISNESEERNKRKAIRKMEEGNQRDESPVENNYGKKSYSCYLLSNRRQVTAEETKRAHKLATKHSSAQPSFKVVMKPMNVYYYFFLDIPKEWRSNHIPGTNSLEMKLRIPPREKTWSVRLKSKAKFGIGKGWYKFALDNNLEESDVCIFELKQGSKASKKTVIFDVIIFRVVDEVVPLTPSTPKRRLN